MRSIRLRGVHCVLVLLFIKRVFVFRVRLLFEDHGPGQKAMWNLCDFIEHPDMMVSIYPLSDLRSFRMYVTNAYNVLDSCFGSHVCLNTTVIALFTMMLCYGVNLSSGISQYISIYADYIHSIILLIGLLEHSK